MEKMAEHRCLPLASQPCAQCGEMLEPPVYCEICGANISPEHTCAPRPLPHICTPEAAEGRCVACGEAFPHAQYCVTCGGEITPSHRCSAKPATYVHRPDPVHVCPSNTLLRCPTCNELLPGREYCADCGAETTPVHTCALQPLKHVCSPVMTMPRRCSHCGEHLPGYQHCTLCGADTTPEHECSS